MKVGVQKMRKDKMKEKKVIEKCKKGSEDQGQMVYGQLYKDGSLEIAFWPIMSKMIFRSKFDGYLGSRSR